MKVILTQDVPDLGDAGDIKDVATGHARNFLIPRGLAVAATRGAVKTAQVQKKVRKRQEIRLTEQAESLAERMAALTLTFQAKAGPTGRLYGSVTTADIAGALERELGVRLDRRKIQSGPLREIGEHTVSVQLSHEVEAQVQAVVRGEGEEETTEGLPEEAAESPGEQEPVE
jgi:large subunit ribosomal protein L9